MPDIQIHIGDCRQVMAEMEPNSVDAIVCDPPYGIAIIDEAWDTFKDSKDYQLWCQEWAEEAMRIAKPGAFLIAFSATRMIHRLTTGVEDAGWEIRDQGVWLYRSGHPKNRDAGWMIDKKLGVDDQRPVVGIRRLPDTTKSAAGFAALTSETGKSIMRDVEITEAYSEEAKRFDGWAAPLKPAIEPWALARKPMGQTLADNLLEWGTGALNIPACRPKVEGEDDRYPANVVTLDDDDQFRHFRADGHAVADYKKASQDERPRTGDEGFHYTVKPLDLMRHLVRLVTPPDGVVLDPFAGSGTTLEAAFIEGIDAIGIEINPEFEEVIKARIYRPRQMSLGL